MQKIGNTLNVIYLESEAFYALIDEVVQHVKSTHGTPPEQWITDTEAMNMLGITSKTTLQKYRDEGYIRYSQIGRKVIMYDRNSILGFLDQNAKNTF